jgi:hypothetical protein
LAAWIDDEDESGRSRLVDARVARYAVIEALAEVGLPVNLVSDWYRLARTTTGRAMVIIVSSQRSTARLNALIPGYRDAATLGASTPIPSSALQTVLRPGDTAELTMTTVGVGLARNGYLVMICDVRKDG